MAHIGGIPIDKYCIICDKCIDWEAQRRQIEQEVRDSAYHIISYKGATCYAIGLALVRISEAILRNQNSVLTVSTFMNGEFGLEDVCLSVPCIVSEFGVQRIIESHLPEQELAALSASASVLNKAIEQLDIKA
jgi:L-lactate dehydrogenase